MECLAELDNLIETFNRADPCIVETAQVVTDSETKSAKYEETMKLLQELSDKSHVLFTGDNDHELVPIIFYNINNILPIRDDIKSGIIKSECEISTIDHLIDCIVDFIVTAKEMTIFTTEQFIKMACHTKDIELYSYEQMEPEELMGYFLKEKLLNEIDERRQKLTLENLQNINGWNERGWGGELNYDFLDYMKSTLYDVSIFTTPAFPYGECWDSTHYHFFIGRSKETNDLIGYYTYIVWT